MSMRLFYKIDRQEKGFEVEKERKHRNVKKWVVFCDKTGKIIAFVKLISKQNFQLKNGRKQQILHGPLSKIFDIHVR